jgi:mono/diheme cytochrome c family protein
MRKSLALAALVPVAAAALLVHDGSVRAQGGAERGPELFRKHCASCHGETGMGDGPIAWLVFPRPRNFARSEFRLITTDNRVPTDDDLLRVITNGMPGSAMPPHDRLPEADRRLLAKTVRDLWRTGLRAKYQAEGVEGSELDDFVGQDTAPGNAIDLAGEREPTDEDLARGRILYLQNCAPCHGRDGRGDADRKLVDSLGDPAPARDFTKGIFKGGASVRDLFTRLRAGMKGSAMPTYGEDALPREDAWAVAHYVRSLVPPGAQTRVSQTCQTLRVARMEKVPADAAGWKGVKAQYVALMPLWWRDTRPEGLLFQAAQDGEKLVFRIQWEDATVNDAILRPQDFQDGAAIQLSDAEDPPFFGMGDAAAPVTLWSWKASWQKDLQGWQDIETVYPDLNVDNYPEYPGAPGERPSLEKLGAPFHDPKWLAGTAAGNPMSNLKRASAVEVAGAKGAGSVTTAPAAEQSLRGEGTFDRNIWTLVFESPFPPAMGSKHHSIAFAIWDGQAGDRNGQKSVTIWHRLALE